MRLLFWIASKNLAFRRLHAVCAILGIAFGVATVVAIQVVDHNTVVNLREHHRRFTGDPDWVLTLHNPRATKVADAQSALERQPGLRMNTPVISERVAISDEKRELKGIPFFALKPEAGATFDAYAVRSGRDFRAGERGVFLAAFKAAKDGGLKIGRSYKLQRPAVTPHGCADGQLIDLEDRSRPSGPALELKLIGVLAPHHLGLSNNGRSLVLPHADGVELMGGTPHLTRWWVQLGPDSSPGIVKDQLESVFRIDVPEAREVGETREERAFRSGVRLASFMALGLGLFIIFHLLTLAVTSWVRQVGLLGALGLTGRTLAGVFLLEALMLAVIGTAAGLGIGLVIAKLMLGARMTTLGWGRPVQQFEIPWDTLGWVAAAGIVACLLGAIHPIARVRRVAIIDALKQGEAALGDAAAPRWLLPLILALLPPSVLGLAWLLHPMDKEFVEVSFLVTLVFGGFVMTLWTLPTVLGTVLGACIKPFERTQRVLPYLLRKGLARGIRRFAGSVTGLSLVAAGIVTLHAITGALKDDKDEWAARALPGKVFVELPGVGRKRLEPLRNIEGVRSLTPLDALFRQGTLEVRGVSVPDVLADGLLSGSDDETRRRLFEQGRGIVVTTNLARERDLKLGDDIPLTTLKGRRSFEVVAIDDRFGFRPHDPAYALIEEKTMRQIFCRNNDRVSFLSIGLLPGHDETAVADAVRAAVIGAFGSENTRTWTGAQQRQEYRDEINADFAIFDVILLLTAILAGMGLLNSLLVSGMERTKETGLLRAVGVTSKQVYKLLMSEAVMLGLTSGLLGSAIGVILSEVAVRGLASLSGLPLVHSFDFWWVLISIAALAAFAAVAAVIPARRAGSADVIAAIKYE